jgi:tetratricopeptide (TPR) repeat protein
VDGDAGQPAGTLRVPGQSGGRARHAGPSRRSTRHHLRAIEDAAAQGDLASRATLLANHANSRLDAGDVATASEQAAQAQRIVVEFELAGSSAGYIATLCAQCARAQGQYAVALQSCERAESLLAERNPARVPVARLHLAQVWLDLGQHARALQVLDGAALESARALPARYAVRWLVLLARVKRRLGPRQAPAVAALLAEAATRVPSDGWPELAFIVGTEQALELDPQAAIEALGSVSRQARQAALHGAELGALLQRARLAATADPAAARQAALAALDLAQTTEALHTDRAWRWLAPAMALAGPGASAAERARAAAWAQDGQKWLRNTAAVQMAPEFVDSFLQQHPVNRALLGWPPAATGSTA